MVSAMVRRAVMVIAAPALVAGASAAPAMASEKYDDDDKYKSVAIKVCKVVHDYDDDKDDKYKDDKYDKDEKNKDKDKKKFTIHIKTDHDYAKVKLRDGECDKVYVDYKYPKFKVTEDYKKGYELDYMKGYDGAYKHGDDGKFKFDKGDKYVKVVVHNEKKDKDDDYKH